MVKKNTTAGILAIILGLFMIFSPVSGVAVIGLISGILLLIAGIALAYNGFVERGYGIKWIFFLILGIINAIAGVYFLLNLYQVSSWGIWAYVFTGILILISGTLALVLGESKSNLQKNGGLIGITIGVLFIIVGYFNINPLFLALLIGAALLIYGIFNVRD